MSDRAALSLTVALPGLPALSIGLSRLRTDISDWSGFWRERFAPFFYLNVRQDFALEGGASGSSWLPLTPAYARWKAQRFRGAGILMRSGVLRASLTGPDASYSVFRPGPTSLEIGTTVPYAGFHQVGTRRMVARPPLRVNGAFMTVVGKELQRWVESRWQEHRTAFVSDVQQGLQERLV